MDTTNSSENIHARGLQNKALYQQTLKNLKKIKLDAADKLMHEAHFNVFEQTDCLHCANCCKTTSPAIYEKDIDRLSKRLKMRPSTFIDKFLDFDLSDSCYVLKFSPCTFLDNENYCTVYEDRPIACRTYPHTDRKRVSQINSITLQNTLICPAVQQILEHVEKKMEKYK
jgi:Fe-S-cluster containining protein